MSEPPPGVWSHSLGRMLHGEEAERLRGLLERERAIQEDSLLSDLQAWAEKWADSISPAMRVELSAILRKIE